MRAMYLVAALAAVGCVRRVDPAGHTGGDGKYKGAHAIELEQNTGHATGIVTYPGGDRVDWKKIELPANAQGSLALELKWRAPRPGLDLAFEVWNEWGDKLGGVDARKWNSKRKAARRASAKKSTTIENVKGTIYISVFASNRGDAGRYSLEATFTPIEQAYDPKFDEQLQKMLDDGLRIPEPPKLALVFPPCGDTYDKSNPDCVANPPPCDRANKDKNNPSCKHLCDENKLDPTNPDCKQFYQCTTDTWEDPKKNPACADVDPPQKPVVQPIYFEIVNTDQKDQKLWILFAIGKNSPVDTGWTGSVVDKDQHPLKKGKFTVVKVRGGMAYATVDMKLDEVNRNKNVVVYPPTE